jgi:hypothetical protein
MWYEGRPKGVKGMIASDGMDGVLRFQTIERVPDGATLHTVDVKPAAERRAL